MVRPPRPEYAVKGLALTDHQFHQLHLRLDKTRQNSATVTVDRTALAALLSDHAKLHAHIDTLERNLRYVGSDKETA